MYALKQTHISECLEKKTLGTLDSSRIECNDISLKKTTTTQQ